MERTDKRSLKLSGTNKEKDGQMKDEIYSFDTVQEAVPCANFAPCE